MIKYLLDTNVLLWYFWGTDRVRSIRDIAACEEADVFISVVSLWEIAIKVRTGKLVVNLDELRLFANNHAFNELPLTGDCLKAYLELPKLHKDPFDHILLAQAITYPMRFITGDSILADYSSLVRVV